MNITVTKNQVSVNTDYILNDKEYNVNQCYFTFSDEYTDDLVKKAIFVQGTTTIEMSIINNQCQIPAEVLNNGQFELRVYAYEVDGDELLLRYSPSYTTAYVRTGSYIENAESPEVITPTQFEQYMQAMNDGLNEVANVDIEAEQLDNGMSVTITNRYGEDKTVYAYDGEKGETGATPNIQIGTVVTGDHSEVTRTGTNENPIFNFVLEKGDKGDTGNGIATVTKTATSGLVDTYTITYTNGTTTTFNVTNGKGITNIAKTSTSGLEDTYTITYNDNTTSTFTVTNGNGIANIEKTSTVDNVDTYTITYTNGTTSTFTVTNSTVTNQEFEELKAEHEELVNTLPRVEGTGESITLDNTAQYKMNVALNPSELSQTTYTGVQLFDKNTVVTGYINANGSVSSNNAYVTTDYISIDSSSQYSKTATNSPRIKLYDENKNLLDTSSYSDISSFGNQGTYTIPNVNAKYIRFTIRVETGFTDINTTMFVKGSTLPTSYEPYVGGVPSPSPSYPQPIKKVTGNNTINVCGKNLCKITKTSQTVNDVVFTINNDGSITAYGTASAEINFYLTTSPHIQLDTEKKYFLSGSPTTASSSTYRLMGRCISSDNSSSYVADNTGNGISVTSGTKELRVYINIKSGETIDTTFYPMVEIGDSKTSFEQYQGQTYPINLGSLEYCKIGDYSDEFYLDNGSWYKRGIIRKYTNGISSIITSGGTGRITLKSSSDLHDMTSSTNVFVNGLSKNVIISNQSEYSKPRYNTGWGGLTMVYPSNVIEQIGVTTEEELLNWFNNNEELYLVINESYDYPDITPITDTTLINQLNNLYNQIKSYKGQTNITQTNAELPFNIDASALYDLNNLISRVATLEVE